MFLEEPSKIMRDLSLVPRHGPQLITSATQDKFSPFELTTLIRFMLLQTESSVSYLKKGFIPKKTT